MSLHTCIFFSLHEIQDMATSLQVPPGVTMAAIPADVHVCCTHEGHESIKCNKTFSLAVM